MGCMAHIEEGTRVECKKNGPFDGKRGRVEDVWQGVAKVDMGQTTILEPINYFKKVTYGD
jgi:hypothetical protein